jgi:peptidoglycan hydrolase CwlO-like protein
MFKAIRITNELEDKKGKYAESQNKLAELTHHFREFRNSMERNERRNERIVEEFREKAALLEEENRKVF